MACACLSAKYLAGKVHALLRARTAGLGRQRGHDVGIRRRAPLEQALGELCAFATVVLESDGDVGVVQRQEVLLQRSKIGANLGLIRVA